MMKMSNSFQKKQIAMEMGLQIIWVIFSKKFNTNKNLEFITASINKKLILSKSRLEAAFQMLDSVFFQKKHLNLLFTIKQDGNGFLSIEDLTSLIKNFDKHKEYIEKMFNSFDSNGDNQVYFIIKSRLFYFYFMILNFFHKFVCRFL